MRELLPVAASQRNGAVFGWRSSFYLFGSCGILYGFLLLLLLREPARSQAAVSISTIEAHLKVKTKEWNVMATVRELFSNLMATVRELFSNPMVRILTAVFVGANFVAMIFLTWMPFFPLSEIRDESGDGWFERHGLLADRIRVWGHQRRHSGR